MFDYDPFLTSEENADRIRASDACFFSLWGVGILSVVLASWWDSSLAVSEFLQPTRRLAVCVIAFLLIVFLLYIAWEEGKEAWRYSRLTRKREQESKYNRELAKRREEYAASRSRPSGVTLH